MEVLFPTSHSMFVSFHICTSSCELRIKYLFWGSNSKFNYTEIN